MSVKRTMMLAGTLTVLLAPTMLSASVVARFVVEQVDQATYQYYHADLLYTHDGDNRGPYGAEHDLARDNIYATFQSFGLDVEYDGFWYGGRQYYNVVGTQVGTVYPARQYIIGAHYDSVGNPGADDDASGVAALMELARILSQYETDCTIKYIAFDLEEVGLRGSQAYVNEHSNDDIRGMVELDMIAWDNGDFATKLHGNAYSGSLTDAVAAAMLEYGNGLTPIPAEAASNSDHAPFQQAGFKAILVIEDNYKHNPCYHQPCDSVDTPDYISYEMAVAHVRGMVAFLADTAGLFVEDCDENGIPDADEILAEPALDCNENGFLDLCEPGGDQDCNGNLQPDVCDIYFEISQDCNENNVPDECEVGGLEDCNNNGIFDLCDIYNGTSSDWNANGIPDDCEPKRVYYIDDDAPGDPGPGDPSVSDPAEDGSSTHPFDAIQEAIPLAIPGDVILVADGVYTGVGNTEIDFAGRPVLLCSAGGPSACTIDGQGAARAFIMQSGETPETRVEGFTIVNGYADIVGGAIYCEDSNPTVADCYIINCTAPFGGALRCLGGSPTLLRCTIAGNSSADDGGALNCYMGSLTVSDCVLHNNWTDDDGGAICCNSGQLTIRNSTFSRNGAGQMGGAVFCGADTDAVITNCILGEDTAAVGAEIALSGGIDIPTLTVAYSDVQDGEYGVYIQGGGVLNWGTGNIVADPLFFDPDNGDFHLAPGSACIDAGDPGFVADPGEMDIDRELRTWNERVDMGGDEFGSHHYGDVNCNGVINGFDIDAFVLALDGPGAYDAAYPDCDIMLADVNGDGAVNGFDIDAFVELLM